MPGPMTFQSFASTVWAFLCPQPETDARLNPPPIFDTYGQALNTIRNTQDDELNQAIADLSKDLFEETRERRGHVESRASATVTASGIGLAALGGITSLWGQLSPKLYAWLPASTLGVIVLALVYLIGAMQGTQRVYGEIARATLDPTDVAPVQGEVLSTYRLRVSAKRIEYSIYNYRANNKALGFVFAAQRRLKYGVFLLALAGSIVVLGQVSKSAITGTTPISITAQTVQLYAASHAPASVPAAPTGLPSPQVAKPASSAPSARSDSPAPSLLNHPGIASDAGHAGPPLMGSGNQ